MWGGILTELNFNTNFTFNFPNTYSNILLHLTHWQYWFWFWFSYYLVLYYLLFLRLVRRRLLGFSPKLVTSFRAHGKWGDLVVCLVPLSWCLNILSNSNFILRMVEWQSESSLFTVRIRGKQWYWVYKFELRSIKKLFAVSGEVGIHKWVSSRIRAANWGSLGLMQEKNNWLSRQYTWGGAYPLNSLSSTCPETSIFGDRPILPVYRLVDKTTYLNYYHSQLSGRTCILSFRPVFGYMGAKRPITLGQSIRGRGYLNYLSRIDGAGLPINHVFNNNLHTKKTNTNGCAHIRVFWGEEILLRFNNSIVQNKGTENNFYLVIKQKRYGTSKAPVGNWPSAKIPMVFNGNGGHQNLDFLPQYSVGAANGRISRRLLRTKRILVLPTNTNITLITNSFDVMHSWFIPGLGVKLDCIPGRSTHHNIFINHSGFYYGQCAEICGRYHHHMPIRVCALPFEQFILWWGHYGSPIFLGGNNCRVNYLAWGHRAVRW